MWRDPLFGGARRVRQGPPGDRTGRTEHASPDGGESGPWQRRNNGPDELALTAVDTVGDAEARKTRGTFNVSFRNNTLNFVAFKYVLVFVDSSNIEVGRTAFAYGLGLGPDERREAIGNFTLHAVETIAEANRIEHLVVELMLDPS